MGCRNPSRSPASPEVQSEQELLVNGFKLQETLLIQDTLHMMAGLRCNSWMILPEGLHGAESQGVLFLRLGPPCVDGLRRIMTNSCSGACLLLQSCYRAFKLPQPLLTLVDSQDSQDDLAGFAPYASQKSAVRLLKQSP